MMLCRADFEELLPHLFKAVDHAVSEESVSPTHECISRWKDDGGSVSATPSREHARATVVPMSTGRTAQITELHLTQT